MSWRTVVIREHCKLQFKNAHLVIRKEQSYLIHLSEIQTLVIDTTQVSVTTTLLAELTKQKIKVIFCDENSNPYGEIIPYYNSHNNSKRIKEQINWDTITKEELWTCIVKNKILNQAKLLEKYKKLGTKKILSYYDEIQHFDTSNREGHAAKVYFNSLFYTNFSRDAENNINAALDYGYTIILSAFNREIVACGYLTQLGIFHRNEYNSFNLSCDLMEPFRVLVDEIVYLNMNRHLTPDYKLELINILNQKITFIEQEYFLSNAIQIYLQKIFQTLNKNDLSIFKSFEFI